MPDTERAQEIRAELEKLAPYPDGEMATARSLGRYLAMEAQLAWARVTGMDHPVTPADVGILTGYFAGAHALLALATAAPADADAVAQEIREAFEPPGIGEWLWEHLGDDAERIAALAEKLARVTAPAEAGEVARLKAELSRVQGAAQTLGKIITRHAQSMEAARIEMIQNGPEAAMQWILNSLPDVSDEAPEDQWDGKETATQWIDRTQAADRAAEAEPRAAAAGLVVVDPADLREEDLRVDVWRNGAVASEMQRCSVRITHLPTGLVETSDGRSPLETKARALTALAQRVAAGDTR